MRDLNQSAFRRLETDYGDMVMLSNVGWLFFHRKLTIAPAKPSTSNNPVSQVAKTHYGTDAG